MISQIVDPPERLRDEAQELAEKIAKNSPAAMAATKRALWGALELGLTDACRAGAAELVSMWGHPDQTEGPAAFAEKREPEWAELRATPSLADLLFAPATTTGDATLAACTTAGRRRDSWPRCATGPTDGSPPRSADAGVDRRRRRSAVMLPDGPDVVATLFGVWRAGGRVRAAQPAADRRPRSAHIIESRSTRPRSSPRLAALDRIGDRPWSSWPMDGPRPTGTRGTRRRCRRRAHPVHVGHDRATRSRCSCATAGVLDAAGRRASAKLRRAGDRSRVPARRCPTSSRCRCRCGPGIYNVLFAFRVGAPVVVMDGFDTARVRRSSSPSSASARRCCRPRP